MSWLDKTQCSPETLCFFIAYWRGISLRHPIIRSPKPGKVSGRSSELIQEAISMMVTSHHYCSYMFACLCSSPNPQFLNKNSRNYSYLPERTNFMLIANIWYLSKALHHLNKQWDIPLCVMRITGPVNDLFTVGPKGITQWGPEPSLLNYILLTTSSPTTIIYYFQIPA